MRHDKNIGTTPVGIKALIIENHDNTFTIFSIGKGGAIITAPTEKEAKEKFEEAIDLAFAIKNLSTYYIVGKSKIDDIPLNKAKKFVATKPEFNYEEVSCNDDK